MTISMNEVRFRTPFELAVTPLHASRILVIGSCFSEIIKLYYGQAFGPIGCDHIVYNNAGQLPEAPPHPLEDYDFQVVMLPLRTAMPEQLTMRLDHADLAGHEAAFEEACQRLLHMLHGALAYRATRPMMTFVANFTTPQQNHAGRLLPRYDLRNPVYFVERLNRVIADEIAGMANVHLLDIDQISASLGRQYIQDDVIWLTSHGSFLSNFDLTFDGNRLEAPYPVGDHYPMRTTEFAIAICHELAAMVRTLRQLDQVKLVIVDLDDTLWRGVVAEEGCDRPGVTEGWPSGFAEALVMLKKRGVLLAIASKNDERRIRDLWPGLYGGRLELADFASVKINWEPKADNIADILVETNLLPRNVIFIDDNPVERAQVQATYPGMRILGSSPYIFRRMLLWAPETQVAYITEESARRTQMVQAQVERETSRITLSRQEFLDTLGVAIRVFRIDRVDDPRFPRSFELINKSNQFNTTGRRWQQHEMHAAFASGTVAWAFEVTDRFTRYGLVGVAMVEGMRIAQFVMSCRVIGLGVEQAVIAAVLGRITRDRPAAVSAAYVATDANFLCQDLYARCGFEPDGDDWMMPPEMQLSGPAHVSEVVFDVEAVD